MPRSESAVAPLRSGAAARWRWAIGLVVGWWTIGGVVLLVGACRRAPDAEREREAAGSAVAVAGLAAGKVGQAVPSAAPEQTAAYCGACHAEQLSAWHGTDHARANQLLADAELGDALAEGRRLADGGSAMVVGRDEAGGVVLVEDGGPADGARYPVKAVLGYHPLRQMLVETSDGDGRLQPTDLAWDVEREEWFNVFGQEGRRHGEWGHWTGRGMNWNSMCAQCHMTGYQKQYDAATDTYASTWVEQGISCTQCHGPVAPGHGTEGATAATGLASWIKERDRAEQSCAYCHARNEALTAEFPPGARYEDHFRLTLPVQAGVFWPDGQQRDEDFNWTSVKLSRMHHAGVSCMDCHDPHTTKTVLPVENNALCMQCHSAPGRVMPLTQVATPVIDPTAHSRHGLGSTGNQCVSCHMPTTPYMERAPRHDHGWLKPDPLLTKELGIPNACNGCHSEESVDWAIAHTQDWYGDKMDSRQRARARAVHAAQTGDTGATEALLGLLAGEDIPAWRATYLQLLAPVAAEHAEVRGAAVAATEHADPMVRSAAAQVLAGTAEAAQVLTPLLDDPVRLVRLDAAWALPEAVARRPDLAAEQQAYLALTLDQPGGRLRQGQHLANQGQMLEAEAEIRLAANWDRYSPGIHEAHAQVLQALARMPQAAAAFYRAAQLRPKDGNAMFTAGLAYAEAGLMEQSQRALRAAVERQPELDRAWYNLGLLLVQTGAREDGLAALREAEARAPSVPDYAYAIATVLWQTGDREGARAAAQRALAADPGFTPARRLLGMP
ncbi:multiheme c-type cytochrome [Actomonas aquatica]|uniref:Multiheme c-type cytochrome n=1 Tax=Actomonas aquatica TaxID=2866162 RepID=A0ABZ1C8A0_9BACT|nr:tetratricopeptide repeat protein [Opitutus sp. WL0086]WRQ87914.1 multiheme c-type cytochrome [Opitutus sp. WL0086]